MGRNQLALQIAQRLVELNAGRNYEYYKLLGVANLMMGKNVEASKVFGKLLGIDQSDGFTNVHMGFAVKAEGKV